MAKKILLVEDDQTLVHKLSDLLCAEGYIVDSACDGDTGWSKARSSEYDLIVLDIMLPGGLDGVSLCRMIRKSTAKYVPIFMLTARGTVNDQILGLESGADKYIVKPPTLGVFLADVRAELRRPTHEQSRAQDELLAGDLRVDLTARRAYRAGAEIKLSNKEFALLTVFMRNEQAVLSRDFLIANVWGEDYLLAESDKRTVDVHIRWLREKIEDNPSKPKRISTVRGVGYRFEG
ncbi:MAG: response regulator transcription factor [Chloroflexi bacterium]|nr:response regulator transcription factor [Chloroflexota bacterium]